MTNTNRKHSAKKKLISAIAMLTVSAVTLSTATYAWFTMNKEVSVVGMELKAHAEEGLLINEVKAAASPTWDEQAQAAASPVTYALRPASTSDLTTWWHANSLKSSDEAGIDDLSKTVDIDGSGTKYTDISPAALTNNTIIGAEDAGTGEKATGNTQAETHVYYKDASFGSGSQYDDGEGFYVNYKYYIKASSTTDLKVPAGKLGVTVTATIKDGATPTALDAALRVGVKIDDDYLIFAPVASAGSGTADTGYKVTDDKFGSGSTDVTAYTAKQGINTSELSIPAVNSNGKLVDVYVWFEGEDKNCMSDNLTASLNSYAINIKFTDDAI